MTTLDGKEIDRETVPECAYLARLVDSSRPLTTVSVSRNSSGQLRFFLTKLAHDYATEVYYSGQYMELYSLWFIDELLEKNSEQK